MVETVGHDVVPKGIERDTHRAAELLKSASRAISSSDGGAMGVGIQRIAQLEAVVPSVNHHVMSISVGHSLTR